MTDRQTKLVVDAGTWPDKRVVMAKGHQVLFMGTTTDIGNKQARLVQSAWAVAPPHCWGVLDGLTLSSAKLSGSSACKAGQDRPLLSYRLCPALCAAPALQGLRQGGLRAKSPQLLISHEGAYSGLLPVSHAASCRHTGDDLPAQGGQSCHQGTGGPPPRPGARHSGGSPPQRPSESPACPEANRSASGRPNMSRHQAPMPVRR